MTYVDELRRQQELHKSVVPGPPLPIICEKHQTTWAPCRICAALAHEAALEKMQAFFAEHPEHEQLYAFYKLRLLTDMEPIFKEIDERMQRYLDTAYNSGGR